MIELPKVRIEVKNGLGTKVFLDDKEIEGLREVRFRKTEHDIPVMEMEFAACNVEINGQFLPQLPDSLKGFYRRMETNESNSLEKAENLIAEMTKEIQRLRGKESA